MRTLILCLLVTISAFNSQAFAHSLHYEVQVSTHFVTNNAQKQLTALDVTFLYDETISLVLLQEQKDLKKLTKKLMKELDLLGYFTQLKSRNTVIQTNRAINSYLEKGKRSVLSLHFTLPLKSPQKLADDITFELNHADPSASAILYYNDSSHLSWDQQVMKNCKANVAEKKRFSEGEFPQIANVKCKNL